MTLTGNDLINAGFKEGKTIGVALEIAEKHFNNLAKEEKLLLLKGVLANPSTFLNDEKLSSLAQEILTPADDTIALNIESKSYQIYGAEAIEQGALSQMETAMKLPVTVAGALMPDAHRDTACLLAGYWLPEIRLFLTAWV